MVEAVPNANGAATAFKSASASDAPTKQGHLPPADNEKGDAFPHSSSASTQLKPGSDTALHSEPDSDEANEKAPPGDQPGQGRAVTGFKWFMTVSSILSSTFLYALDQTVVADVEPKIVERFGEIQKLPWLPIAFLLAAVSTNLIWYVDGQTGLYFQIPAHGSASAGGKYTVSSTRNGYTSRVSSSSRLAQRFVLRHRR